MAGRAGRRGIDTIGHVIHLTNLFKNMDQLTLKTIMKGKPQTLVSKFKISYNLLLNLINIGETDYTKYAKRSMVQGDIEKTMKVYYDAICKLQNEIDNLLLIIDKSSAPIEIVEEYIELRQKRIVSINKKRKEIDRSIQHIQDKYKTIDKYTEIVTKYKSKIDELNKLDKLLIDTEKTLDTNVYNVLKLMEDENFIKKSDDTKYTLTNKGHIATHIRETHCLVFAELIEQKVFHNFQPKELVGILSCFTNITVQEEKRAIIPISDYSKVKDTIMTIYDMYQKQENNEIKNMIETGIDYRIQFDLIDYSIKWCECENENDCKKLLHELSLEKEIFLGEFIKAILKINNITSEMEKIAELFGDMEFLSILKQVPQLTLKYVATNQSLYV
jgi:superfamily II RNA helicase